jgi:hypothetical protein
VTLRKNYSTEIKNLAALKELAAALGFTQTRGQHRGEGSIRRLLEAIADGEVHVVPSRETRGADPSLDIMPAALAALAAAGLVELGDPAYTFPPITPVPLQGQPLSEQILSDRR